ncbi:MAG: AAA domain-containing protein [Bacteroidota bacterium]
MVTLKIDEVKNTHVTDPIKNILRNYLRRLTNLTGNNRSLLLLRLYAEQLMDLHEVNGLNGYPSFEIINALIAGKEVKLCQVLDSRAEANNEASKKLKKLQRVDNFIFEERGSNDLHVGWPFLRGKFADGTLVQCPLLFFPVSIIQENNYWCLMPRNQAGITMNKSFLLAYAFYNKIKLDEELLEANFEDFDADSTVFRTELYQLIKDKVEINFNPDNFRDELTAFTEFKKSDFENKHRNGEIKLFPEAVLGIFPQAGSQLVPDYLHLLESETISDLEDFFAHKNGAPEATQETESSLIEKPIKEEKIYTPFTLDAFQENAIKAVKNGRSVVVQGPPGTGKSQLICNLMADAVASGKRALLVCQKRAALDVVYERLKSKDLADFIGLVHDFRNERKTIFAKIARQIESIDDFKAFNRSIDAIQMERRFFQVCRAIDRITEELDNFKRILFDDTECGLSVKELYLTSNPHGDTINIRQEYQHFDFGYLPEFLRKLKQYTQYAARFEQDEYPWKERKSFSGLKLSDLKVIENIVSDIPSYQKKLAEETQKTISQPLDIDDCLSFRAREDDVLAIIALLQDEVVYRYFQNMIPETDDETSTLWFLNIERVVANCFIDIGPEVSIPSEHLGKFQEVLQSRMKAQGNLIRRIRWGLTSKDKFWLKRVLVANGFAYNREGLMAMETRIDNRLNLEHHFTALKKKAWLIDLPGNYRLDSIKTWFDKQKLAMRAKLIFSSLREIQKVVNPQQLTREEFIAMLYKLTKVVSDVPQRKESWLRYLSPYQVRHLVQEPLLEKEYIKTLRRDYDSLCDFDKLKETLVSAEKDVISRLNDATGNWEFEAHELLLQNSLRLVWIDHIEAKYPILRSVSSLRMEELREELIRMVEEKQKLSQDILILRARERAYEGMEYNRLNNRVTYRDLLHQVTKKKKIWPLRKVITDFQDELFRVIPCWMASPESVSAIFPMTEMFDLVIFDEASQCFSERGIPAMYRGKQLLIAGDDMQLKPNELYQVRWEEEADHPDLEVDSLLDLAERYLPTTHLQGHYRSQSLDLIDFSNRHFYEGRLQLLPDRHVMNRHIPGIEYVKVEGVWENQTNLAEAQRVTERVFNMVKEDPRKEIGVVTFNAPQQMLILDLLEEKFAQEGINLPPSLFVKNIENVQGDEKDVIIFSIGYAPDKKKKMNMQFGSLNMVGGENRLNVAVTRARERIILVCSIWPEELKTDDIKNDGPKLLRKYLEFAREVDQRRFKPQVHYSVKQQSTWYLNTQLKQWAERKFQKLQFEADTLPLADLHFKMDGNHLGIILTDDVRYFTSLSVKDSFAYVPSLISQKNWEYHIVFSRNYWQDHERVEDDLLRFIGSKIDG